MLRAASAVAEMALWLRPALPNLDLQVMDRFKTQVEPACVSRDQLHA